MAEALGIAASIVAVTIPALHITRLLLTDLQQLKDAPETLKRLAEDVRSIDTGLELLKGIDEKDWENIGAPVAEHAKTCISTHARSCALFRDGLQQWTKHSSDGKLVWQNRANVGFFKKSQVTAMSEQVQNCGISITAVVSIANLYCTNRNYRFSEEVKNAISASDADIRAALTTVRRRLDVFENKLEELSPSSDDDDDDDDDEEEEAAAAPGRKAEVLQKLEELHRATDANQKLFDELQAKLQENRAKASPGYHTRSTTIIMGANNSGLAVGIVNGGSVTFTGK